MSDTNDPTPLLSNVPGRVDLKREEEGEWFEPIPESGKLGPNQVELSAALLLDDHGNGLRRIKVRGRSTPEYEKAEQELNRRLLRMPPKTRTAAQRSGLDQLTAKHCIADWEFTDSDGNDVPCTPAYRQAVMEQKELRTHRAFVYLAVNALEESPREAAEEDLGN